MEIKTAEFVTSLDQYSEKPPITLPQLAVVGKSNVGKSSLINSLCNRRKLCKTSATPGKTRLINVFLINGNFHLVDLPGYGFAKVDKKEKMRWGAMMDDYFQQSTHLRHVLHLVQPWEILCYSSEDGQGRSELLGMLGGLLQKPEEPETEELEEETELDETEE